MNQFDDLPLNVPSIYEQFPLTDLPASASATSEKLFQRLYQLPLPIRWRQYLWYLLRRIGLDLSWFEPFQTYWSEVLGGRPLWGVDDLYFLKNWYRIKFQKNIIPDTTSAAVHLQAWQEPELLYQLLHLVYKGSIINELGVIKLMQRHLHRHPQVILEFGCGTAPVATTFIEFFGQNLPKIYISDLQSIAFHYAAYKFRRQPQVRPLLLTAESNFTLAIKEPVDVIFCLTVFEHLNSPLNTVQHFHKLLKPNGLLIFDYLKGEGEGLDTHQAVEQRPAVLRFLDENFQIVYGKLNFNEGMNITVARKNQQLLKSL